MKCSRCGFVSSRNFYRCPYCGHVHPDENNLLNFNIKIGNLFSVRLNTLILIILSNIWGVFLFADIALGFRWCISYWALLVIAGVYVFSSFIIGKSPIITAVEKIDVFLFVGLILGIFAFKIDGLFDLRQYIPTLVIPAVTIIGTLVSLVLLFVRRNNKFHPIWTEVLIILHFVAMLVIYVLFIIGKYTPNASFLHNFFVLGGALGVVEQILLYVALGASFLYLVNYNIALFGHILKEVKIRYGGEERD